ncbi:MAG TPA: ATP-binding cassette domain-containing protein, partial [Acidimicrobiales bacterium]|nr:ATP-binding cassette domain-containing protein [Acidimicrobiales bacterium]
AKHGALEPWWHTYTADERAEAVASLERMGVGHFAERTIGTLSSGERQRVLLARTLLGDPGVVILDEPTAGLDLGGREAFVQTIGGLARDPSSPPLVFVTHHVEEIPSGFTSLLLLKDGQVAARGPIEETLTADVLSDVFGLRLRVRYEDGRWSAVGEH